MNNENAGIVLNTAQTRNALSSRVSSLALASITSQTQGLLLRMFSDPYLLEKEEKASLVAQLRCVNLDVHPAIEELKESVRLAPNSFIAQLKLGELWMRLRVTEKAEEHTKLAGLLAQNLAQSDLARKQAATIRTMKRDGIERGDYGTPWRSFMRPLRRLWTRRNRTEAALDSV